MDALGSTVAVAVAVAGVGVGVGETQAPVADQPKET